MAKTKTIQRGLPLNAALDPSKQKEFNQKVQAAKEKVKEGVSEPGVVYVSHLPWGFDEQPLKSYFSQFGAINKLRVSRNKKTGNSRGYAYIQFDSDEVAKIVAETMNNYLMFEKLIKCKHLTTVHPDTFKNANKTFQISKVQERAIKRHNCRKTPAAATLKAAVAVKKYKKKKNKLAELGIDYQLECLEPGYVKKDKTEEDKTEKVEVKEEIFSDNEMKTRNKGDRSLKKTKRTAGKSDQTSVNKTSAAIEKVIVDISDDETGDTVRAERSSDKTAKDVRKSGGKRKSSAAKESKSGTDGKRQKLGLKKVASKKKR